MKEALQLKITGIVQGVGFRPFVYNAAIKHGVFGWVNNASDAVYVQVEGENDQLDAFVLEISNNAPAAAHIKEIEIAEVSVEGFTGFEIRESEEHAGAATTHVSADLAICEKCAAELFDPTDRRYRYPFINCTNCGPRFTIIDKLPYDRPFTSMASFEMCPSCLREYKDPTNRRFHAQPDACFECGPALMWWENATVARETVSTCADDASSEQDVQYADEQQALQGAEGVDESHPWQVAEGVDESHPWQVAHNREESDCILAKAVACLKKGEIVAVKGLGGFHLVCDAQNEQALANLRKRKRREGKPFAVMLENIESIREFCLVNADEESILKGAQHPIVLLRKKSGARFACGLADDLPELGVLLPYTPVQMLLMHDFVQAGGTMLVMTSGNVHDEPIVTDDEEARVKLGEIADAIVGNNRPIKSRYDDSVVRVLDFGELGTALQVVRRARGLAPVPLKIPSGAQAADTAADTAQVAASDVAGVQVAESVAAGSQVAESVTDGTQETTPAVAGAQAAELAADGSQGAMPAVGVAQVAESAASEAQESQTAVSDADVAQNGAAGQTALPQDCVLAVGPEQKNTFCLVNKNKDAFVSQHLGDMENAETYNAWLQTLAHYQRLFDIEPTVLAHDMHPEYLSTKWALEQVQSKAIPAYAVQHHHAHIASVLAENEITGAALGIAFDGTGFGVDGNIWGGEAFVANTSDFERFGNFCYVPMPGGAGAIKNPLRMAYGVLWACDLQEHPWAKRTFEEMDANPQLLDAMIEQGINTPHTSSVGRLFDAASALLRICTHPKYEGEGAVLLEAALHAGETVASVAASQAGDALQADETPSACAESQAGVTASQGDASGSDVAPQPCTALSSGVASQADTASQPSKPLSQGRFDTRYSIAITKNVATETSTAQDTSIFLFDPAQTFEALLDDALADVPASTISRKFHDAFVELILTCAELFRAMYDLNTVALGGGVFMNRYIVETVVPLLAQAGFNVALSKDLPPNDGGVSYGQAVVAYSRMQQTKAD